MQHTLVDRPLLPRKFSAHRRDLDLGSGSWVRLTGAINLGEPSPATIAEEIRKFRLAHKAVYDTTTCSLDEPLTSGEQTKAPKSIDEDDVDK